MIYFSDDTDDKVISMINNCYPQKTIYLREESFKNIMFWRDFRRKVLALYGISFKTYFEHVKEQNKIFEQMSNATMPQKTLDMLARLKGIVVNGTNKH
jgi:predicted glycosyltransferase